MQDMVKQGRRRWPVRRRRAALPDPLASLSSAQREAIRDGVRHGHRTPSGALSYSNAGLARHLGVPRRAVEAVWWRLADEGRRRG
jgi:hypothetical protein